MLKGENITTVSKHEPVEYKYKYAKDWFVLTEWQGWLILFSFMWPLMALTARWQSRKIRVSQATPWTEILLCLGNGYIIWEISSFGERLIGAYAALSGTALYLITAARDAFQSARR